MIRGRCPICGKGFETATLDAWPSFPFCSDRCKLIDLGRWLDGDYAVATPPSENEDEIPDEEAEAE